MKYSLHQNIIEAIESWDTASGEDDWSDEVFNRLAASVFQYQYEHNEPYRRYCDGQGVVPDNLASYRDIPAVPTDVFKYLKLFCGDISTRVFRTSGTTLSDRGEHHFATLDVYKKALLSPFQKYCLPDNKAMRMLILAPLPADLPDSSLSFMLGELVARWGAQGSGFFVSTKDDSLVLNLQQFDDALKQSVRDNVPVMVLSTAFALVEYFDFAQENIALIAGSRVMETGGLKGRTREVSRAELYAMIKNRWGLSDPQIISEYSMTELSSQAYTDNFARQNSVNDRWCVPPWVRLEMVDPLTLKPLNERGQKGLIRWIDLANVDSVCAVQTSDMGVLDELGRVSLLGRARNAQLRGCSLTIEEIVEKSNPKRISGANH